ncbi:hypothetical protein ACTHQF_07720 [Pedobacter sp. SAFR-022]|uniref:hypothetical protein n=1 Tax=Pedobacter sp. SAFR-022 TaxID=3436861 RepID=UPI003F7DB81C
MANRFRENHPKRTFTKVYQQYGSYKPYLATDFFNRCGYTDCSDFWFGGVNNFHIDHFVPWKNYPANPNLKIDYQNLVYCCSYVNILKSNDETDYIDPCDVDFNTHFNRDLSGNIEPVATSTSANYMYKKLKLFMRRYQIIWMLDSILERMKKLESAIKNPNNLSIKTELQVLHSDLGMEMTSYIDYLRKNQ